MATGIDLSIRDYRNLLAEEMPPWMVIDDFDLLNYFSLSGFSYTEKIDSILIDGVEYLRDDWTLGDLKTELGIAGTGNYDACKIHIIEKINSDDEVLIYTNPNIIVLDSMATIQKKVDDRRNLLLREMDPRLATVDGLLYFWEAIFQSVRQTFGGELETDAGYMARAISELFGQSTSLRYIRSVFDKYALTNYSIIDTRDDPTHWNSKSASDSVTLFLDPIDYDKIPFLNQLFISISLAGKRLFVLCPAQNHDCYGLNYGNGTDADDYVIPAPFIPGQGVLGVGYGTLYGAIYGN